MLWLCSEFAPINDSDVSLDVKSAKGGVLTVEINGTLYRYKAEGTPKGFQPSKTNPEPPVSETAQAIDIRNYVERLAKHSKGKALVWLEKGYGPAYEKQDTDGAWVPVVSKK